MAALGVICIFIAWGLGFLAIGYVVDKLITFD